MRALVYAISLRAMMMMGSSTSHEQPSEILMAWSHAPTFSLGMYCVPMSNVSIEQANMRKSARLHAQIAETPAPPLLSLSVQRALWYL